MSHRVHCQIRKSARGHGRVSLGLVGVDDATGLREALHDAGFAVGDCVTLVSTVWLDDVLGKLAAAESSRGA